MQRRLLNVALLLGAASLAACEFDETVVPRGSARPVVHVVLNPTDNRDIQVLLERTLGGRVPTGDGRYDPDEPVLSAGGEPITGARVAIHRIGGPIVDSGVAFEGAASGGGRGKGLYRLVNAGCNLVCPANGIALSRGGVYELRIRTAEGEELTARTTIPEGIVRPDTNGVRVTFDATRDTYTFRWPAAEGFARYAVQLSTPFGPFQTFSSVESLAVNGSLRNFQQDRLPRVFVPGFTQVLSAWAVDRAYFDYFRSGNDPFTGSGLVSNVVGGSGVFGSIFPIRTQFLNVVAPFDEPEDGRWLEAGATTGFPVELYVYADGGFVSGRYDDVFDADLRTRRGVLGARRNGAITLHVLEAMSARDTSWSMTLEYRGDTLVTRSAVKGEQRWVRAPD